MTIDVSAYIPEATNGVFFDKWPTDDERDFPVGNTIFILHEMVSQPKRVLLELVCIANNPKNRWKVVGQTEIEEL